MVVCKLLSNENGVVRYSYQPESNGTVGILEYDVLQDVGKVAERAENDVECGFYCNPVYAMIRNNMDHLPKERVIRWYW